MSPGLALSLAGAGLAALPLFLSAYWIGLLTQALMFAAFALSLDLLVGYTGLPSLGHAVFFGLAGYVAALSVTRWSLDPWLAAGLGIALSVAVALGFAPLATRLRGLTFLTVTLAFGQVAWGVAIRWTSFTGGENGIPGVRRPYLPVLSLDRTDHFYWFTLLCVALVSLLMVRIGHSPVGLSLSGVRESDMRMSALGYDIHWRRVAAFALAALAGAVFGVLSAWFNRFIGPGSLDWPLSAQMLLAVIVGGAGSLWGPFVAGAGLHVLKTSLVGQTERWPMVLGLLYVVTVLFLPDGLASLPNRLRLLAGFFRGQIGGRRDPRAHKGLG